MKEPGGWLAGWQVSGAPARVRLSTDGGLSWATLGLDILESQLNIADSALVLPGSWIEVSFADRSLPERILLNPE